MVTGISGVAKGRKRFFSNTRTICDMLEEEGGLGEERC